ncbi:MAG TPA: DUF2306 domain-containing protein [Bacteroidia bacterium]|jgi:hypothetical protein|nr:DUF2306 domain-containing protein [Bacteroidia bacterium]
MYSRKLTAKKALVTGGLILFWAPVIFLSLLLIYNTLPYFTFNRDISFLEERSVLYDKPVWRISFYVHIFAGALCIGAALLQFSSFILKKRKRIHIISGKIYVFVVLLIGAPSGFYMTFFAKGGFLERACFMLMAVFWFYSTYKGFVAAAREKNFLSHKYWMIRSYAMALTAVTFRVYHILFYLWGFGHFDNYAISLWISVFGNAAIAELIIFSQSKKYLTTLTT